MAPQRVSLSCAIMPVERKGEKEREQILNSDFQLRQRLRFFVVEQTYNIFLGLSFIILYSLLSLIFTCILDKRLFLLEKTIKYVDTMYRLCEHYIRT